MIIYNSRATFSMTLNKSMSFLLASYEVEPLLRRVVETPPGRHNIPYWVLSTCSYELSDVVAHFYNSTLRTSGVVPHQWLTDIVTPAPKIPNPGTLSDFSYAYSISYNREVSCFVMATSSNHS